MTNENILKKAIKKAVKNGWKNWIPKQIFNEPNYANKPWVYKVIFSHDFNKALWGKKLMSVNIDKYLDNEGERAINCSGGAEAEFILPAWQFHLQQLVVLSEENIWEYLKKFI